MGAELNEIRRLRRIGRLMKGKHTAKMRATIAATEATGRETAESTEERRKKRRKMMVATKTRESNGAATNAFDGNCRNCGKYGHKDETCWSTSPTKSSGKGHGGKSKHVNVLDE